MLIILGKNINLQPRDKDKLLEPRDKDKSILDQFFCKFGPKNFFFLIFTFKSHSNIYIGHIYQFNQLIINENNALQ